MCMDSVYYQVLINDENVGSMITKSDLEQCDPMLSYLFIMFAHGHSSLLTKIWGWGVRDMKYMVLRCIEELLFSHAPFKVNNSNLNIS